MPPYAETQSYVKKVQAFAAAYRGTPSTAAERRDRPSPSLLLDRLRIA